MIDHLLGEPPARLHPVVWMGRYLGWARRRGTPSLRSGAVAWLGGALLSVLIARVAEGAASRLPAPLRPLARAALLKPLFAWRALDTAVGEVQAAADLEAARAALSTHLVSRDTSALPEAEVVGAALESLSENLSDSLVAPLLWYALGGLPAAALYRYANTADAMWGYRTPELERFGKAAARIDDLLNLLPARLTGLLLCALDRSGGGARVMLSDARNTASPNAGYPMSALAGVLGVELSKRGVYVLNAGGRLPARADLPRARRFVRRAAWTAALLGGLWTFRR
nr:adenosylcobinamide-phosphate synthase CbiB [Deinobacterium chartae]